VIWIAATVSDAPTQACGVMNVEASKLGWRDSVGSTIGENVGADTFPIVGNRCVTIRTKRRRVSSHSLSADVQPALRICTEGNGYKAFGKCGDLVLGNRD
jgi:hypothetical protein